MFGVESPSPSKATKEDEANDVPETSELTEDVDMKDLVVKDDIDGEEEEAAAPAPAEKESKEAAVVHADNNMDNEDSLNLDIGEDEAKLLQGEVRRMMSADARFINLRR